MYQMRSFAERERQLFHVCLTAASIGMKWLNLEKKHAAANAP